MIPIVAVSGCPEKDKETGKRLYDGIYDEDGPSDLHRRQVHGVRRDRPGEGPPIPSVPLTAVLSRKQFSSRATAISEHYEKPEGRLLQDSGLAAALLRGMESPSTRSGRLIERYFSSGKHSRLLDTHRYLNIFKVALHVAMSMLSLPGHRTGRTCRPTTTPT